MNQKALLRQLKNALLIALGCALFSLGFDLFLQPNQINVGGVSGIGQLLTHLTGFGSVALWSVLINVPLFLVSIRGVGKKFFVGSLCGMLLSNLFLSLFERIPAPVTEPLLATLYGGLLTGLGLGLVFVAGASTGGVDIVARLLRPSFPNFPIGRIMLAIDIVTVTLTGVVFGDINKALYSAVTLYVCSMVLDGVVYGLDYSVVALVISDQHQTICQEITSKLDRGVTILRGQGYYSGQDKRVILCAIKKRQVAELKELVMGIDPTAFVILQEAHQVVGEGFKRYSKNDL
ncbi:MAG TPA: YitT family protein [Candidatus Avoscillospira avicola]|uniref:YitT family protein n=1 Tax=Candidatus Avoscillospira avicola TaxID=2840706 RepID=A0A9D1AQ88_9FIRM|nr:YitT family protein [Candidatus Avoscillospira avicola]